MYKACIFDLDGTLLDTLPTIVHYSNRALKAFGFREISPEQFRSMCRLSFKDYYEKLLLYGGCPKNEIEALRDRIGFYDREIYLEDPLYLTRPFAGIPETLAQLKEQGVILAILTNKPDQIARDVVAAVFPDTFDLCVGYTGSNHSKPDPRALWNLIERLPPTKEECIYVGDTDIDVAAANNAGVFSVAAGWGYQPAVELIKYKPGAITSSPEDILSFFGHNSLKQKEI